MLRPELVLESWALWQLVSYVFLESNPLGVIFGALIVWSVGGALEVTWGGRRVLAFSVGVTVVSAALTVVLGLAVPAIGSFAYFGGTVLTTSLWVAYGLSFGRGQTNFFGMPVNGNVFALIGAGFVLLNGVFNSWLAVIPEVFGLGLTYAYVKTGSPRSLWLRLQGLRLQRQLRGRSKHLRLIAKERNTSTDSDHYLH